MKTSFSLAVCSVIASLLLFSCSKKEEGIPSVVLSAPGNELSITFRVTTPSKTLEYLVLYKGDTVIKPSVLGIETNSTNFKDGLTIVQAGNVANITDNYTLSAGKRLTNTAVANEQTLTIKNKTGAVMQVIARAYDEGVAFRYVLLGNESDTAQIMREHTAFALPNGRAWLQNHGLSTEWGPAYEDYYPEVSIGTSAPDSSGFSFPGLFNTQKGAWLLISESDLDEGFYGSRFNSICTNGVYTLRRPLTGDGLGTGSVIPKSMYPWQLPWRFIIVSDKATEIANSNLVHHLASVSKIDDTGWIKPGRASWSWWGEHDSPKDFQRLKAYVDVAKELGWEYSLVDANWDLMKNGGSINDLINYANSQGVGILMWYNSGGAHNNVTERPRDIMSDPIKRKEEFKKLAEWGVKGVKIDFFQSDKQEIIQLYRDILKDAAEAHILVVFHGCTLPRGWSRTYPNLMSMEGILGAEQYGWSAAFARKAASHNTVVAFTRNVVGSMDYTPATFSDYDVAKHQTTNTHELALPIVFESGIMHWADRADSYKKQTKEVKNLMRSIPTTWDDTKCLDGEPGKLVVMARKSGENWFVAGINGDSTIKELTIPLPFITEDRKVLLYTDGATPRDIQYSEQTLTTGGALKVRMLPKGGFAAQITK